MNEIEVIHDPEKRIEIIDLRDAGSPRCGVRFDHHWRLKALEYGAQLLFFDWGRDHHRLGCRHASLSETCYGFCFVSRPEHCLSIIDPGHVE